MENYFKLIPGKQPILISIPHAGTYIPEHITTQFTNEAKLVPDTDWYVDRLYDCLTDMDVSILKSDYSRYVIDLNRSPDNIPLYSGRFETSLCPTNTFNEHAIYLNGNIPDQSEIKNRIQNYWLPYHQKIKEVLAQIKTQYGYALLWDAHSIKSQIPKLFSGQLFDFNLGTNNGKSCSDELSSKLLQALQSQKQYSSVLNGRFKGGYITRQYGRPEQNIHAVQLELSQSCYMNEESLEYVEVKASQVKQLIKELINIILDFSSF